jgi:hypothetical protein
VQRSLLGRWLLAGLLVHCWLRTTNAHAGRQVWEFDAAADPDPAVDAARQAFVDRRHQLKHSADLFMHIQVCACLLADRCLAFFFPPQ